MNHELMNQYLKPETETIFELPVPPDGKIGDLELDRVIDHARRFGRCLFTVAGGKILELELHEDDTVGLHT